jgi:hypothetical protein
MWRPAVPAAPARRRRRRPQYGYTVPGYSTVYVQCVTVSVHTIRSVKVPQKKARVRKSNGVVSVGYLLGSFFVRPLPQAGAGVRACAGRHFNKIRPRRMKGMNLIVEMLRTVNYYAGDSNKSSLQ